MIFFFNQIEYDVLAIDFFKIFINFFFINVIIKFFYFFISIDLHKCAAG